ncbi:hypothetical protein QOZ88_02880 [Blastococcus sp. BMG 814]|uniref:Uncharacterized protein n=1 Tax=Blastococcus carthaginiensis TaxID=3050034 RepID=A0ABT9I8T8_9ACTN|nr:hypothetical protein [Blastococcus carthaginiensis]MDP5181569.1 hypothetical protein [Blastococcus carthaginiensis]
MPTSEAPPPTSLRWLTAGGADTDALVATMAARLPADGIAAPTLGQRYRLLRSTYRLLDSRILAAAVSCLDQDVAGPLVHWLATFRELREAARSTRDDPQTPEATVVLAEGHRLSSSQTTEILLHVGGSTIPIRFRLELTADLGQTSVVLRRGAIDEVVCAAALASSLWYADASPELWKGNAPPRELRLLVRPPVEVLLVPPQRTVQVPEPGAEPLASLAVPGTRKPPPAHPG